MFWGKPVGRVSADSLPTDGQQTADSQPTGFLGSSSSQLPQQQHKHEQDLGTYNLPEPIEMAWLTTPVTAKD